MKLNAIKINPLITTKKGIKNIQLERLSNVVALVGRNGSGKTRILDIIQESLAFSMDINFLANNTIENQPDFLQEIMGNLVPLKNYINQKEKLKKLDYSLAKNPDDIGLQVEKSETERSILDTPNRVNIERSIATLTPKIDQARIQVESNYILRINIQDIKVFQNIVQASPSNKITIDGILRNKKVRDDINVMDIIKENGLTFFNGLPNDLAYGKFTSIDESTNPDEQEAFQRYKILKGYIFDFLKKELTWKSNNKPVMNSQTIGKQVSFNGIWMLDGVEFDYEKLSDGERTLFTYALLFFLLAQNESLKVRESIILIDEPELHLHPDSEIELIEGLRRVIGEKGQLIIATHSINILSSLNYEEIFMVKNGDITHPSRGTPQQTLSQLMSLDTRIQKLSEFVTSLSTWTFVNFMAQCFSDPEVIQSAKENDPQVESLKKTIKEKSNKETNMFLDFGAGKGRLFEQIKSDYDFIDKIRYSALEPDSGSHQTLTDLGAHKIYKSYEELPANKFDFIILCNVLHEIDLDFWVPILNSIINSLKDDGYLIIMEAKVLNKGEKIGKIGYLLLENEEIQKLLNLNELPLEIKSPYNPESITCSVIHKKSLSNISDDNLKECLKALEENTLLKIETLREQSSKEPNNIVLGRKSAFLSQQHINARLALKHLKLN